MISKSNGPLAEVNSHDIDTMRWFTGSEFQNTLCSGELQVPGCQNGISDFMIMLFWQHPFAYWYAGNFGWGPGRGYAYDAKSWK